MAKLNVLFKVTLFISLFSFSLSSMASQTSFGIEEQLLSDISQNKRPSIDRKEVNIFPLENTQSQSASYLSSLGHIASSALDGMTKIVLKGYGFYTVVALPIVTALETNLQANALSTALMPMSEMDLLTKENCLKHFYDSKHCDELLGNPESQYSLITARYAFLPQISYIEMEATTQNVLQVKRKAKTKKSKSHHKYLSQTSTQTRNEDDYLMGFEIELHSQSPFHMEGVLFWPKLNLELGKDFRSEKNLAKNEQSTSCDQSFSKIQDFQQELQDGKKFPSIIEPRLFQQNDLEFRTKKLMNNKEIGLNKKEISDAMKQVILFFEEFNTFNTKANECFKIFEDKLLIGKHKLEVSEVIQYIPQSTHQFPLYNLENFFIGIKDLKILSSAAQYTLENFLATMHGTRCVDYFGSENFELTANNDVIDGMNLFLCRMGFPKIWKELKDPIEKALFYNISYYSNYLFNVSQYKDKELIKAPFIRLKNKLTFYPRFDIKDLFNLDHIKTVFTTSSELKGKLNSLVEKIKQEGNFKVVSSDKKVLSDRISIEQWLNSDLLTRSFETYSTKVSVKDLCPSNKDCKMLMEIRGYPSKKYTDNNFSELVETQEWFFNKFKPTQSKMMLDATSKNLDNLIQSIKELPK